MALLTKWKSSALTIAVDLTLRGISSPKRCARNLAELYVSSCGMMPKKGQRSKIYEEFFLLCRAHDIKEIKEEFERLSR